MPSKSISYLLSKDLPVVFTNKAISGFGGFSIVARFCRRIGLIETFREDFPDRKRSNNSIRSVEIVFAFLVGVLRGELSALPMCHGSARTFLCRVSVHLCTGAYTPLGSYPGSGLHHLRPVRHPGRKPQGLQSQKEGPSLTPSAPGLSGRSQDGAACLAPERYHLTRAFVTTSCSGF